MKSFPNPRRALLPGALALVSCCIPAFAAPSTEEAAVTAPASQIESKPVPPPVSTEAAVDIGGVKIPYRATAGKIRLQDDSGKPTAAIFYVSYERTAGSGSSQRPVLFAFNGGPGSSAVWLHLGMLGPKRVAISGDGTQPPLPPVGLTENSQSILDVCDLVFIDPVSTGYSRAEDPAKAETFHGLEADVEAVGEFIRRWITEHQRWASPKFLLGESYGGVRAAGLAESLQSKYGMNLNGVVLLSSLLDFRTIQNSQGSDLAYQVFLPAFTATAIHHGKVEDSGNAVVEEARRFAFGDYAAALLQGAELDPAARDAIAAKLEALTSLPAALWIEQNLRISPSRFRGELLRAEGKVLGRFDARVAWDSGDLSEPYPDYDPSYALAYGAFSTAMLDYLGRDLGWKEDEPYEILTDKVMPWKWGSDNRIVNLSGRLASAMRDNPRLRVLVMGAHADLATPPEGVAYSFRHLLGLSPALRENVSFVTYDSGHMFYLNPPDLEKSRRDLVDFIRAAMDGSAR